MMWPVDLGTSLWPRTGLATTYILLLGMVQARSVNNVKNTTTTVQLTPSRVRLGQSFKTVGCGCTSCWGDLGAGSVEADVFYIPFIVSVQYIV